jgi:hypothetical protein
MAVTPLQHFGFDPEGDAQNQRLFHQRAGIDWSVSVGCSMNAG